MKNQTTKAAAAKQANLDAVVNLIAIPDDGKLMAIEDRRTTPAVEVQIVPIRLTKGEKRTAASQKRVQVDVAKQLAAAAKNTTESNAKALTKFINSKDEDGAPTEVTTGYQGPMKALRDRVKAGKYTKAANGQPSCGDEVAQILGALEPTEVIAACMTAMDITNPYLALNIGQQSMNLRNKLRGQLKRGEIGMGVLREAVEVTIEARPNKPATAPKAEVKEEAAPAPKTPVVTKPRTRKAKAAK